MPEVPLAELYEFFKYSILSALLAGMVAPAVGSYLLVRRTGFLGVALPQFAAAGVALGFALLPWWQEHMGWLLATHHEDGAHLAMEYHLLWAGLTTFGGLASLALARRRDPDGTEAGHIAAGFAIASALTVLLAHLSPTGSVYIDGLLRGEILAIDVHEFTLLASVLGAVGLLLLWRHRYLTLVGFDPDLARVLGHRVALGEALFATLAGSTVAAGTMTVGPLVLFGLLVLPPLAARPLARSMAGFLAWACLLGFASSALGLLGSFSLDWPLGPTLVLAAALLLGLTHGWTQLRRGSAPS